MIAFPRLGAVAGIGAVALLTAACTLEIDTGGETVTRSFDVDDFSEIELGNAFEATIVVGEETAVDVEINSELVDKLQVEVEDNRLHIGVDGGLISSSGPMQVTIATPELSALAIGGASDVIVEDLDAVHFDLDVDGASNLEAAGSITNLTLNVDGASSVDLGRTTVDTADVSIDGAADVELTDVATVTGDVGGASTLDLPDTGTIDVTTSGAATLD